MLYANVEGQKRTAEPDLMGFCHGCGAPMIPKCGELKEWHWAHQIGSDCDSWSEPTGPWHLSWQEPLLPAHVEVPMAPHRADIVGNGGIVVELQHSGISATEIRQREEFYGNMVWLFDATFRFRVVCSGEMAFFAFGRTKHIDQCRKPVFLDFGRTIVQVQRFTDLFPKCSGIGYARDRNWFVSEYLAGYIREGARVLPVLSDDESKANPWDRNCPYHAMEYETKWIDPTTGSLRVVPKGAPCLRLDYEWKSDKRPLYYNIIDQFPGLSLGWQKSEVQDMINLLSGMAVILDGRLRVMPQKADMMRVQMTVTSAESLLARMDQHINSGRIPMLKHSTKARIIAFAEEYERQTYGRVLKRHGKGPNTQRSLFDALPPDS